MDSFILLAYASLAASRTLLQRLLACLNFTLESEDLSFWYKWKKWFLWTMAAAQAAEKHGDEWGLTWYLWWGVNTSIPNWNHSQNALAAAEALSLKIHPWNHLLWNISQMMTKTVWISTRIVLSYVIKQGIPFWVCWKIKGNWDKNMFRISQWRKAIVEQILESEERNK